MSTKHKQFFLIYEIKQIPILEARLRAGEQFDVIGLDFEVELEMQKRGISYTPLRSVAHSLEGERAPIELTRKAANEWYVHPELAFFQHDGILLGEPHAGPLHHYFGMLVYYLALFEQILSRPEVRKLIIPETFHTVGERADPTAYFKERLPVDVARLVAERRGLAIEVVRAPQYGSKQTLWQVRISDRTVRFAIGLLNKAVTVLRSPRPLKVLSTDPWARIEPFVKDMPDVELVMTRRKEIPHMGRALWSTRARFHHPLDFASRDIRQLAQERAREFARAWDALGEDPDITKLFIYNDVSFWPLAKNILAAIVKEHGEDAVATIESTKAMCAHYNINRVLLFSSTKGYNNLIARVAQRTDIPSVEMQHAIEVTEVSHPYARLCSRYLAAYGALTKRRYESFGIDPSRILPLGTSRFDSYSELIADSYIQNLLQKLSLPEGPRALVLLSHIFTSLELMSATSYSAWDELCDFASMQKSIPELQLLLRPKPEPHREDFYNRQETRALFSGETHMVQHESLRELLGLVDFVVCGNSTVVLEAMLSKKPVLVYLPRAIDHDFDEYAQAGAVLLARTPEELCVHARALLDPEIRAGVVARANAFLSDNFMFDGKASLRIRDFIRELPAAL